MPDYQQGKIYTIRCRTDDTMIYVGSTIQSLAKRWGGHKVHSKEESRKNMLIYRTINGDWNNWYIELYELYPCSCKAELCRKEGEIIRLIANLNVKIEGRTQKEYRDNNKEKIAEKKKERYEENKEKLLEKMKEYRDNNKEKIAEQKKERYEENKEKLKEYREANKEKLKEYRKLYYLRKKLEKQQQTQQ